MAKLPSDILVPALIILGMFSAFAFLTIASDILPGANWDIVAADLLPLIPLVSTLVIGLYVVFKLVGRR